MTTALFLLDTILNAFTIMLAARLGGYRHAALRLLCAAALGAASAQAARRAGLSRALTAALSLPTAYAMMWLSCGACAVRRPMRSTLLLLSAAGLLGGVVLAFQGATGSAGIGLLLGAACTVCLFLASARAAQAAGDTRRLTVICRFRGKEAAFDAIADSGNSLRDYLTHQPVIVIPEETGRKKLALEGAALRPVFADTAGGRIMMACFTPEKVVLVERGKRISVRAAAAFSPGLAEGAPALVPAAMLGREENDASDMKE